MRAQLAEQSSTLLDNHPRIKELKAQIADLDNQIRAEAETIARSFENDAKLAGARVDSQTASLDQLKSQAASTNGDDVQLRALERDAKSQRDLLESYLAKYREATSRDTINSTPADARVISRATVSNVPAYPKKLPTVLIAAFATLMLSSGFILTKEILAAPGLRAERRRRPLFAAKVMRRDWRLSSATGRSAPPRSRRQFDRRRRLQSASRRHCRRAARRFRRRAGDEYEPDRDQACPGAGRKFAGRAGRPRLRRNRDQGDFERAVGRRSCRTRPRRGLVRQHHHQGQASRRCI